MFFSWNCKYGQGTDVIVNGVCNDLQLCFPPFPNTASSKVLLFLLLAGRNSRRSSNNRKLKCLEILSFHKHPLWWQRLSLHILSKPSLSKFNIHSKFASKSLGREVNFFNCVEFLTKNATIQASQEINAFYHHFVEMTVRSLQMSKSNLWVTFNVFFKAATFSSHHKDLLS